MKFKDFLEEIESCYEQVKYEDSFNIEIECENNISYSIESGNSFVGGDKEGFMSSELGNVQYNGLSEIAEELYNKIISAESTIVEISVCV